MADLLLTLAALSGELPVSQVRRLPSTDAYLSKTVKSLKKEGLLTVYSRNGLRGLRLTPAAKKLLLTNHQEWFLPYLSGATETNRLKSDIPRRLRLHRMAEVQVTMVNAGVRTFPWEKPAIFQPTPPPAGTRISQPVYYSSREIKEIGPQSAKIRGSRATGVLLTDGFIFAVYNTADTQMKWEYKAEMRMKALLQIELCQYRLPAQFVHAEQSAIVFGAGMEQMSALMDAGGNGRHNYFVLDGSFGHFYYLTSDHAGEFILQLLCDPGRKAVLDNILSEDLSPSRPGWVENDAMDGESPVLFGYTCNMPRIRRFDTALNLHEKTGTLFCFNFQEEAIRRVCGPRVSIQCLDMEKVESIL